jgi:hypothetical protein
MACTQRAVHAVYTRVNTHLKHGFTCPMSHTYSFLHANGSATKKVMYKILYMLMSARNH